MMHHAIMSSCRVSTCHLVSRLLQKRLIQQLHTYIYLVSDDEEQPHIPITRSTTKSDFLSEILFPSQLQSVKSNHNLLSSDKSHIISSSSSEPHHATPSSSKDQHIIRLYERLKSYFDGKHHIQEMMWRESISRDELARVLQRYRHVLVTVTH